MIKVSDKKSWLNYWKKTLIDVDRKGNDVTTDPILVESYFISQVPKKHSDYLWKTSQTKKDTKYINVDICPCFIRSEFEHGKSKNLEEKTYYPFWIPAIMFKDGTLAPLKSKKGLSKPFFVREYLEPNKNNTYRIASIKEVDSALEELEFKEESWSSYWEKCESFFSNVTGKNYESFSKKHKKYIFIQKGELRGLTENIRKLYNRLEETPPVNSLLNSLIDPEKTRISTIPEKYDVVRNKNHVGQMSGEFPLSVSQRESIACFNLMKKSNILAVNGPPGTGKTTFLQSIVANSVVSTVINQQKPELIIACSANNQAITNILESFNVDSEEKLTQRWLPNLSSLGLYLSANDNNKYQICSSEFGNGFLNDFESTDVEEKKKYFLKEYSAYIGECEDIKECRDKLLSIVQFKVSSIKNNLEIAEQYEGIGSILKKAGFSNTGELSEQISSIQDKIDLINLELNLISIAENKLKQAKEQETLFQKTFSFLPKFKNHRASLFQRVLLEINFDQDPDYSDYNSLNHLLNEKVITNSNLLKQLNKDLDSQVDLQNKLKRFSSDYFSCINDWNNTYSEMLKKLYTMTGNEYKELQPLEDMQVRMDFSYRYEAFWYAIHFREAEYLINLETKQTENRRDKERGKISYKEKLQRFAGITPVFISTFHSIPRYSTFYDKTEGEKAYFDLFDLLIVDEAGQVAPDIAIPSFSLAKKAIVVGDVFQIEPVWSVDERLDIVNLKMNNLLPESSSDTTIDNSYKDSGMLCSSGNLMKLAQRACFVKEDNEGGTLLKEHRRCPDNIISYSNRHVYQNKLILTRGNERKAEIDLPLKGFMHIDSISEKVGSSRRNVEDAKIIAKWIESKRMELKDSFKNKEISEILAIVTPYKAQAALIKNELLKINKNEYQELISGTVHALQGAEIDIVIYSTVVSQDDSLFFADNLNMLNVAVSRAKSSFLVFGNLSAIDATKTNPLGLLKKWIQEEENCELSNKIIFDSIDNNDDVVRISDLKAHVNILNQAFETAKSKLIIVSPFISINAINCDSIEYYNHENPKILNSLNIDSIKKQLKATVDRGVDVIIITDSTLDVERNTNKLKQTSQKGRDIIKQSGAKLKVVNGIHSKTIIIDNHTIIEGSFNWFSALRDEKSKYFRLESSIKVKGEPAKEMIKKAKKNWELKLKLNDCVFLFI